MATGPQYLRQRLDFLIESPHPDGGWGYFPRKEAWLEPSALAMLALHGVPEASPAVERAWNRIASWQLDDGSWRPGAGVAGPGTWVTSLAVQLCAVRGCFDRRFERGVGWLLASSGNESNWLARAVAAVRWGEPENDLSHHGWPWLSGTSSWVEPTAHAIVALRLSAPHYRAPALAERVRDAEQLLLTRRCRDGGWNYGSRRAVGVDLPSYPETTALALIGLQASGEAQRDADLARARELLNGTRSRLARGWLAIALQVHGQPVAAPEDALTSNDVMLAALEALAHPAANHALFRTPGSVT